MHVENGMNDLRRPFGFRPGFGFGRPGFGRPFGFGLWNPFLGGFVGGLAAGALLSPFAYPRPYPFYPPYYPFFPFY
jgi:hypothetical protein